MISLWRKDIEKRLALHNEKKYAMTPEEFGYWRGVIDVLDWLLDQPTFDQIS